MALAFAVFALVAALVLLVIALRRSQLERRAALASRAAALDARERVAELAAGKERIRILREMHDVIAHSLAIMIAQADGGSYAVGDQAATQAGADHHRRGPDGPRWPTPGGSWASCAMANPTIRCWPRPVTAGIDDLVDQARAAESEESRCPLVRVGEPRPLPPGTQMARYRICQEGADQRDEARRLPAPRVTVTESWRADDLALTITDAGGDHAAVNAVDGEPLAALGLGLIGMRERAELVGGSCQAGLTEDGYQVRAVLPFRLPGEESE